MKNIQRQTVLNKLDLVVNKLMNLGGPENEDQLAEGGEAIGFFKRDFGIHEWDWPQGVGLYGLLSVTKALPNNEYKDFLYNWFEDNIEKGLPSKNINTTTPLLTLCELNDDYKNQKFEKLCVDWANWLVNCIPRTREGGFQHVTSANGDRQGVRLNESEMWIDTIFMTLLFLNKMGQKYKNQEWIDISIKQVLMHIKYLYDKHTGLFFHGWSFNRNDNFGGVFWCRGNSWFTLGILDYISMFKGSMNAGLKEFILDTYKSQVWQLKRLQGTNGLWHTVLDDPT
ncbi:MAG: glycoside hydrolase family 88 protein, partial [Deferribacteraceae bacterium]|nr:glycoside hydrolase family 88 protein [Deferribacteraceae bacterium]